MVTSTGRLLHRVGASGTRRAKLLRDSILCALGLNGLSERRFRWLVQSEERSPFSLGTVQAGTGAKPRFFWNDRELSLRLSCHKSWKPNQVSEIISAADDICQHQFRLFELGKFDVGHPIEWHTDPVSRRSWPLLCSTKLVKVYPDNASDIKMVWELSRFYHCVTLGQAYLFTRKQKYAQEYVSQISDWIDKNPVLVGPNWLTPMEAAIRLVNWMLSYHLFKDSVAVDLSFTRLLLKALYEHGLFIWRHLEMRRLFHNGRVTTLTGNHYFANIVGLLYLSVMFPQFKHSRKWFVFSYNEFCKELARQIDAEGVHWEYSISYHRFVAEMALSAAILLKRNECEIPLVARDRLEKMLEFTMWYTKPSGQAPMFGDGDDGRLHKFWPFGDVNDHRYLLAIGAELFNRDDFAREAGDTFEEALWLLGPQVLERKTAADSASSHSGCRVFRDSGFVAMKERSLSIMVTATNNGILNTGSHGHNDCLSFEMESNGVPWISDSGTYVYTKDLKERNTFRSSRAHNVVVVDGEEMNSFYDGEFFRLGTEAEPNRFEILEASDYFLCWAKHDGYTRLPDPVRHERRIFFARELSVCVVDDVLSASGVHVFEHFLHLGIGVTVAENRDCRLALESGDLRLSVVVEGPCCEGEVFSDRISPSYGVSLDTTTVTFKAECSGAVRFVTTLIPWTRAQPELVGRSRLAWDRYQNVLHQKDQVL